MEWGRNNYTWDEVQRLLSDGWQPRIKNQGNNRFITIRNLGRERGLGSYTEEKWNRLQEEITRIEEEGREDEIRSPSFEDLYQGINNFRAEIQLLEEGLNEKDAEIHELRNEIANLNNYIEKIDVLVEKLIMPGGYYNLEQIRYWNEISMAEGIIEDFEKTGNSSAADTWREHAIKYHHRMLVMKEIKNKIIEMNKERNIQHLSFKDFLIKFFTIDRSKLESEGEI